MSDVLLLAGKKIVKADHVVALLDQAVTKMRAEEARATCYENALYGIRHRVVQRLGA